MQQYLSDMELVDFAGTPLLAFPRGRHQSLHAASPRVTVTVPVSGDDSDLERALASLYVQTYRDFAVVILDDASKDHGFATACRFAAQNDNAIAYQHPQRLGQVPTWNRALDLAVGSYVKLLTPSDHLLPDFLQVMVGALDAAPEAVLARATTATMIDGRLQARPYFPVSRVLSSATALEQALVGDDLPGPPSAQLIRRSALEKTRARFRTDLATAASLELGLRLLAQGPFIYRREPMVMLGNATTAALPSACVCLREECEARLSALRAFPRDVEPATMVRMTERFASLFNSYRARAEEQGDSAALEREYATALDELVRRMRRNARTPHPVASAG